LTPYQQVKVGWGYYQGKDYYVVPETRLHKNCRRVIAGVLICGMMFFATYKALGSPDLLTLLKSEHETHQDISDIVQR